MKRTDLPEDYAEASGCAVDLVDLEVNDTVQAAIDQDKRQMELHAYRRQQYLNAALAEHRKLIDLRARLRRYSEEAADSIKPLNAGQLAADFKE